MKHVLTPLQPPYAPEIARVLETYPRARDGQLLNLFKVFANSLRFLAGKGVANLLDRNSPLTLREREIVILRVTANLCCEYEWGVHVAAFATAARLSREQVEATRLQGADAACWSTRERVLLRCVDELCTHACVQTATLTELQADWSQAQQLEIFALCGNYHTVSFVANSTRLAPEPFAATFPVAGSVA